MKLDRSFAAALDDGNDKQSAVVRSVVSLANALALDLVRRGGRNGGRARRAGGDGRP